MTSSETASSVLRKALDNHMIDSEDTAVIFFDRALLREKVQEVKSQFPAGTLHTVAIKANPLKKIILFMNSMGMGCEAASLPEIHLALKAGISADAIVSDSPAKTVEELSLALDLGIHINADSIRELEKIEKLLGAGKPKSPIGVRINPQVGAGSIAATSVSDIISKFGVPLENERDALLKAFEKYDWLTGVHVHVGSQGYDLDLLVEGVKRVFDFARHANEHLKRKDIQARVRTIDVGGGIPVQYHPGDGKVSMEDFTDRLKKMTPEMFDGKYQIITEFGRFYHANCAWVVSRIEQLKKVGNKNVVIIHVGADMFLRECYDAGNWHHNFSVLNHDGHIKSATRHAEYDIAGPLCFSGDFIARDVRLPVVEEGDYMIVHDVGAYTFSMWSRYNSRQMPKILGVDGEDIDVLKEREKINDVLDFWE